MDTYRATNTTNGKFYIGSTNNFEKRKKGHLKSKENYPFQNALRNNPEAFEWEVWKDESNEPVLEQALLDMWYGKECCYNLNPYADRVARKDQVRGGVTQGNRHVKNRTGFLSPEWVDSEEYVEHQRNSGKVGGLVTGLKHLKNKTGLFAQTKEQLSENSRKANSQVWESTHDGFRANAGNVARHNIANGWPPGDRVKLN